MFIDKIQGQGCKLKPLSSVSCKKNFLKHLVLVVLLRTNEEREEGNKGEGKEGGGHYFIKLGKPQLRADQHFLCVKYRKDTVAISQTPHHYTL